MHAAVAIHRGNLFRAVGELEYVRKLYIDLLGDRCKLESSLNREIDRLPEKEKDAIRSTFVTGENPAALWTSLLNLTKLVYQELEGQSVPVTAFSMRSGMGFTGTMDPSRSEYGWYADRMNTIINSGGQYAGYSQG